MRPAIELKRKITGAGPTLGILISNNLWLEVIEVAMESGLDYVIVDAEHMAHCPERIVEACRLGRMTGFPVLLRPARTDTESIRMAMDLGPCGLLLPMIESAAQLEQVQAGIYMPPRGQRRPGGHANRWVRTYTYETFKAEVEDHVIVIPQIESAKGLQNAREIAGHPLTTALGVGPFDLSAGLGLCYEPKHPRFQAALAGIRDAAEAADKPVWMIGEPETLVNEGYRFLCIGEPTAMLQGLLTATVQKLRVNGHVVKEVADARGSASAYAAPGSRASLAHVEGNGKGNGKPQVI